MCATVIFGVEELLSSPERPVTCLPFSLAEMWEPIGSYMHSIHLFRKLLPAYDQRHQTYHTMH